MIVNMANVKRIVEQLPIPLDIDYDETVCKLKYKSETYVELRSRIESLCGITAIKNLTEIKNSDEFVVAIGHLDTIDKSIAITVNPFFKKNITAALQNELHSKGINLITSDFLQAISKEVNTEINDNDSIFDKYYIAKSDETWFVADNSNNEFYLENFKNFDVAVGYFTTHEVEQYQIEQKLLHKLIQRESKVDYSEYDRECFEEVIEYYHQKNVDYDQLKEEIKLFINNTNAEWLTIEEKYIEDLVDDNLRDFSSDYSPGQLKSIKSHFIPFFKENFYTDYSEISIAFDNFANNMKLLKEKNLMDVKLSNDKNEDISGLFLPHDDDNTLGSIARAWNVVRIDHTKKYEKMNYDLNLIKQGIRIDNYATELGFHLKRIGRYLTIEEHDSVRIDPKENKFWRNSTGASGSIIDFVVEFEGKDKNDAIRELQMKLDPNFDINKVKDYSSSQNQQFRLFLKDNHDQDSTHVHAYLDKRGIDKSIIDDLLEERKLYQGASRECVFVGYDERGIACWSSARGTGDTKYFCEAPGSDYSVGWYINNNSSTTVITEGCIDALSYMTLMKQKGVDPTSYNYLALGSSNKIKTALENAKTYHPDKLIIALDNDQSGIQAAKKLESMFFDEAFDNVETQMPVNKDWNDDLKDINNKEISKLFENIEYTINDFEIG